jgi:hypothetical protein
MVSAPKNIVVSEPKEFSEPKQRTRRVQFDLAATEVFAMSDQCDPQPAAAAPVFAAPQCWRKLWDESDGAGAPAPSRPVSPPAAPVFAAPQCWRKLWDDNDGAVAPAPVFLESKCCEKPSDDDDASASTASTDGELSSLCERSL